MSNVIAELVVNIGVTGEGGAEKALKNTKVNLGDVYSSGLAAKAAIVGVIYGLERMMMTSAQLGTSLRAMSDVSGDSTADIQKIGFAAQQAGLNAKEAEAAFVGLAQKLQNIDFGGTAGLQGLSLLQSTLNMHGIDFDIEKAKKDHMYAIQKIQQGLPMMNLATQNATLGDLGLLGQKKAFVDQAFNQKNYDKTPLLDTKRLDAVNTKWMNFETHMQKIIADLTSSHGGQLIDELDKIGVALGTLVKNLDNLAQRVGVFQEIAKLFNLLNEAIESKPGTVLGSKSIGESMGYLWKHEKAEFGKDWNGIKDALKNVLPYKTPPAPVGRHPSSVNTKNNVSIQIDGAQDPEEIANQIQKVLNEASSQDPTLTWAN